MGTLSVRITLPPQLYVYNLRPENRILLYNQREICVWWLCQQHLKPSWFLQPWMDVTTAAARTNRPQKHAWSMTQELSSPLARNKKQFTQPLLRPEREWSCKCQCRHERVTPFRSRARRSIEFGHERGVRRNHMGWSYNPLTVDTFKIAVETGDY